MPRPENTYEVLCKEDLFNHIATAQIPVDATLTPANKAGAAQAVMGWLGYALQTLVETNDLRTGKWVLESMLSNDQTGKALAHYQDVTEGDSYKYIKIFHECVTETASQKDINSYFRGQGDLEGKQPSVIANVIKPIAAYCLHLQQATLTDVERRQYNAPYIPRIKAEYKSYNQIERSHISNQLINAVSDHGIDPAQGGIALSDYKTLYDLMDKSTQPTFAAVIHAAIKAHITTYGYLANTHIHEHDDCLQLLQRQISEAGDMAVLTHLVRQPGDLGQLLLHHAEAGNIAVIGKLIKAGAPRNMINAKGETWLQIAIDKGLRRSFPEDFPFTVAERALYKHRDAKTICSELIKAGNLSEKLELGNELVAIIQTHGIGAKGFDINHFSEVMSHLTEPMKPQFIGAIAEAMVSHKGKIEGNLNDVAEKLCEIGHVEALAIALRGKENLRTTLLENYCKNGLVENLRTMFAASAILNPMNIDKDNWIRMLIENGHEDKLDYLPLTEPEKEFSQHCLYEYTTDRLIGGNKEDRLSAALKMLTIIQKHGVHYEFRGIHTSIYSKIACELEKVHPDKIPELISAVAQGIVNQPPMKKMYSWDTRLVQDLCEHQKIDALKIVISSSDILSCAQLLEEYIREKKNYKVRTMLAAGAPRIMTDRLSWMEHMVHHNDHKLTVFNEISYFTLTKDEHALYPQLLINVAFKKHYHDVKARQFVAAKIIDHIEKYGIDKSQGGMDLELYQRCMTYLTGHVLESHIKKFTNTVAKAIRGCPQINEKILPKDYIHQRFLLSDLCDVGHEDTAAIIAQNKIVSDEVWQYLMDDLAAAGNANAIKKLHAAGVPLMSSPYGNTIKPVVTSVFHTAIKSNQLTLLDEIEGAQEYRWPENMPSLLSSAIDGNNMKAVLWLNPSEDDWHRKHQGQSALDKLPNLIDPNSATTEFLAALVSHAIDHGQNFIIDAIHDQMIEAADKLYSINHQGNSLAQAAIQKNNMTAFATLLSKGSGVRREGRWERLQVNDKGETIIDSLLQVTPEISSDELKKYGSYLNLPLANTNEQTVLHGIAQRNDSKHFVRMIMAGADPHRIGGDGMAPIDALIDRNDVGFLKTLNMTLLNSRDINHNTPLHRARAFPARFKKLLEAGVDITVLNSHQRLAMETDTGGIVPYFSDVAPIIKEKQNGLLHERFKQATPVDHLVAAGFDMTALYEGYTPLDHYFISQPLEKIKELGAKHPFIYNAPDKDGNTLLHRAIIRKSQGIDDTGLMDKLQELMQHVIRFLGASTSPLIDITALNHQQLTARDIAVKAGMTGLNPDIDNAVDRNGNNALQRAMIRRDIPAIRAFGGQAGSFIGRHKACGAVKPSGRDEKGIRLI